MNGVRYNLYSYRIVERQIEVTHIQQTRTSTSYYSAVREGVKWRLEMRELLQSQYSVMLQFMQFIQ